MNPTMSTPAIDHPAVGTTPTNDRVRDVGRYALGATLVFAGTSHLTFQRDEFQAQVPDWFPIKADVVVVASGFVEVALGLALLLLGRRRVPVGWVVAGFFVVVFPATSRSGPKATMPSDSIRAPSGSHDSSSNRSSSSGHSGRPARGVPGGRPAPHAPRRRPRCRIHVSVTPGECGSGSARSQTGRWPRLVNISARHNGR